jgi:hypothetical protein
VAFLRQFHTQYVVLGKEFDPRIHLLRYEQSLNYTSCKVCQFQCSQKHQHKRRITQDLSYARMKVSCSGVGYKLPYFKWDNSIKLGRKTTIPYFLYSFRQRKTFQMRARTNQPASDFMNTLRERASGRQNRMPTYITSYTQTPKHSSVTIQKP